MKKKFKKGFTLIELLAVIAVLAVILIIAVPKITSVITNTKTAARDIVIGEIVKAGEIYATKKPQKTYVTVSELYAQGFLDRQPVNPEDGSYIYGVVTIASGISSLEVVDINPLSVYRNRTLGGSSQETLSDGVVTTDGSYIVVGRTNSDNYDVAGTPNYVGSDGWLRLIH